MAIESILKKLGLGDKEIKIYLSCLQLGPAAVRKLAEKAGINRGTTYDILKSLQDKGVVSYYHKEKHQYFIAEDPAALQDLLENQKQQLEKMRDEINSVIPELRSLYDNAASKPVVKYYEGNQGVKTILRDVIECCSRGEKRYYVFSSSAIKSYLYSAYRSFTDDRIKAGISVDSISIGPGGQTAGLDQRKWLNKKKSSPTYIMLYENKIALISVGKDDRPIGVIINDKNTYETQKIIFEFIWTKL